MSCLPKTKPAGGERSEVVCITLDFKVKLPEFSVPQILQLESEF